MRSLVFRDIFDVLDRGGWDYPVSFKPRSDVEETDKDYKILVELPGVSKNQLSIKLENNVLTVSGEKKGDVKNLNYIERNYGKFERSWKVPSQITADDIDAKMEDGILYITIKKKDALKGKEIVIR